MKELSEKLGVDRFTLEMFISFTNQKGVSLTELSNAEFNKHVGDFDRWCSKGIDSMRQHFTNPITRSI